MTGKKGLAMTTIERLAMTGKKGWAMTHPPVIARHARAEAIPRPTGIATLRSQ